MTGYSEYEARVYFEAVDLDVDAVIRALERAIEDATGSPEANVTLLKADR